MVILESTSPVGTTEKLIGWLSDERPDLKFPELGGDKADIQIAYCPERVLPGNTMHELVSNDRVVGGTTDSCSLAAEALYDVFLEGDCHKTDARTAELVKLSENSFRDVNIAFSNELSLICSHFDINVWK